MLNLVSYLLLLIITVIAHEYGHYLACEYYDGKPCFGCLREGKSLIPFIVPIEGDDFYFNLFSEDKETAWVKQIIISGSGLFLTFVFGLTFTFLGTLETQLSPAFLATGVFNILTFIVNFKSPYSDGYKIIMAIKYNKDYVSYLEENNITFTPEKFRGKVEEIQRKYQTNS